MLLEWLRSRCIRRPDFVIGNGETAYLHRWYLLPRNRWINVYLHKFLRDDDDRALHDHPWPSVSILLKGELWEVLAETQPSFALAEYGRGRLIQPGLAIYRRAEHRHRIKVLRGPAYTLFITGPKVREWGFWCPQGFVPWREFVEPGDTGQVGKGCAQ